MGLDPSLMSPVLKPCCHDSQRLFGQMLKLECGCLDLVLMVGLDPSVMKPCCHDLQRPFGQMLKLEYGCLDVVQMVGLDPFVVSLRRGLWHLYHQSVEQNWKSHSYSYNDLLSLWENKIGKTLKRIYLPEEQLLKNVKDPGFHVAWWLDTLDVFLPVLSCHKCITQGFDFMHLTSTGPKIDLKCVRLIKALLMDDNNWHALENVIMELLN
ncbi:isoflavone reductase like protein pcber1 [Quercus suber]|uniref:Isoflavone reductase like protein pcber1 n=1 Tax=Quercus suber TaxID=58331 RepID=A0AAW0M3P1_QUESU